MIQQISDRLVIVGTSHIAARSVREIRAAVTNFQPDAVAIEMDRQRLAGLLHPEAKRTYPLSIIRSIGIGGYLFAVVGGWIQRKLGAIVKIEPGVDMKAAYAVAQEYKLPVILADQQIARTLQNISRRWPRREKFRLFWDLVTAPFRRQLKVTFALQGVPSSKQLAMLLSIFRERYPKLYDILVTERNTHMVGVLKEHQRRYPDSRVLLVVGAGHVEGIIALLSAPAGRNS